MSRVAEEACPSVFVFLPVLVVPAQVPLLAAMNAGDAASDLSAQGGAQQLIYNLWSETAWQPDDQWNL